MFQIKCTFLFLQQYNTCFFVHGLSGPRYLLSAHVSACSVLWHAVGNMQAQMLLEQARSHPVCHADTQTHPIVRPWAPLSLVVKRTVRSIIKPQRTGERLTLYCSSSCTARRSHTVLLAAFVLFFLCFGTHPNTEPQKLQPDWLDLWGTFWLLTCLLVASIASTGCAVGLNSAVLHGWKGRSALPLFLWTVVVIFWTIAGTVKW